MPKISLDIEAILNDLCASEINASTSCAIEEPDARRLGAILVG
jgi:hypothetical protein